jgi:hypothetical protein
MQLSGIKAGRTTSARCGSQPGFTSEFSFLCVSVARADLPFVYSVTFSRPFGTSIRQPKYIPGFASWAILNRPSGAPKDSCTPSVKNV